MEANKITLQIQQQQQKQQRRQRNTMAAQTTYRRQTSKQSSRNLPLGGKDLIIRMLAEVFQVNQTDEGQIKWQQVSSSLVPVSLYSRTTSKWLNYLLAAPTVTSSSNGMSPDSRDFLLLLQQFHHHQQHNNNSKTNAQQQSLEHQRLNQVVFQVVAHDYLDGQCKKILNVKLVQPGTRLGQASDYFVYWKEQPLAASYNHSPSFNSNNSLSRLQNLHLFNNELQQQTLSTANQFVTTCCGQPVITQQAPPMTESQTWGLNFASINDARLFYDICSLNLVDLDFNSEYLKQLTLSITPQNRNNLAVCQNSLPQTICGQQNEQKLIRDFLNYKQRQHNQSIAQASNLKLIQQQNSCQFNDSTLKKQSSQSKCPSCKHLLNLNERQRQHKTDELITSSSDFNNQCPIHAHQRSGDLTTGKHMLTQVRSRSSTRQMATLLDGRVRSHSSLKRSRSFSTPATPDHTRNNCSHQQASGTNCELHRQKEEQMSEIHHPRCLSFMKQQRQGVGVSLPTKKKSFDVERPKKPARGVLRDSTKVNVSNQRQVASMIAQSSHQSSADSSQVLHSKRAMKTKYTSQQSNQNLSSNKQNVEQQLPSRPAAPEDHQCNNSDVELAPRPRRGSLHDQLLQNDQTESERFSNSNSAQRRYTGVDSTEMNQFDPLSSHSASLARAQYANSKNMKEFLSLDAGGVLPAPEQLAAINQRFEEQNCRRQNKSSSWLVEQTKLKLSDQIKPDHQTQGANKDSQASSESECDKNVVEFNERVTDVATTTDDLPLDPLTKRRMYRLTSEEIISERTEPKSFLSTQNEHEQNYRRQHYENKDSDGQTRAISLGPEFEDGSRGRDRRSITGRRRSLERTMCVDLDPLPTVSSTFRKTYCLSPLVQSASPITASGLNSFQNSPDQPLQHLIRVHQEPLVDQISDGIAENIHDRHTRFAGTPKRARTRSTSSYRSNMVQNRSPTFDNTSHKKLREATNQIQAPIGLTSFKSAPDVTYSGYNLRKSNDSDGKNVLRDNADYEENSHFKLATSNVTGHSSYAVPLCSRVQSSQYGRPFHSCPSSLRRIKRNFHHHCDAQQQSAEASLSVDGCNRQPYPTKTAQTDCHYCVCGRRSANANLPVECSIYDESNFASTRNKSFVQQQRRQRCCQNQYNHHHHHTPTVCMNNVSREQVQRKGPEYFVPGPDCVHAVQYRTCGSLQSCRSPLRYGLYESDCDEDLGIAEMPKTSTADAGPCQDLTTCQADLPQACCATKSSHSCNTTLSRSASSFYFRPLDAGTTMPIKPVSGYDQTMARSVLKSRQRARSQPPREPPSSTADTFHLNKSMENVQKLIKEVQNELNAIARCPLESFCSQPPQGPAYNQRFSPVRTDHSVYHSARNASTQMSNEEANPIMGQSGPDRLPKNLWSSATRDANQFHSVGAIRKAGFLSAKKWILKRRQSIELARKQGWKKYWVCLKGTALLFHSVVEKKDIETNSEHDYTINLLAWIQANCASQPNLLANILHEFSDGKDWEGDGPIGQNNAFTDGKLAQCYIERDPRHLIMIDGAIAQPIPEHPKRDFVFCLSTTFGDAYLFQSSCQLESENWILSIHNACAASIARDLIRDEAIKLFETKIRHLELEAEKKLFLRQRLESRLILMSSLGHVDAITNRSSNICDKRNYELDNLNIEDQSKKKVTMRALLCRLNQQLMALDNYIEKIHCELYQLRCYLASCGSQSLFYQNNIAQNRTCARRSISPSLLSFDLPHPRSLLQHVSKPTKLILIKLGVFTVSSFHAFIHARQNDIETMIHQQKSFPSMKTSRENLVGLRLRSRSTSEAITLGTIQNVELENDTEKLLDMANLRVVPVKVTKELLNRICETNSVEDQPGNALLTPDSDSSFSVRDEGEFFLINLKLHSSSNSLTIIKQVLDIVNPELSNLDLLDYSLRLNMSSETKTTKDDCNLNVSSSDPLRKPSIQYEVKRRETLKDWSNYESLELVEKMIFRTELIRSRLDEDSAPFGISIGAQLFVNNSESLLNVYCSYIEWGSVADKSGLKDDDELLMINGVPVMDLDLMFIECIIQDESKLKLVVRSCRSECPPKSTLLDKATWSSPDRGPDGGDGSNSYGKHENSGFTNHQLGTNACSGSQIISDEYISSLVCPPPPTKSIAFLRTGCTFLRQESDLSAEVGAKLHRSLEFPDKIERKIIEKSFNRTNADSVAPTSEIESKTQVDLVELECLDGLEKSHEHDETTQVDEIILPDSKKLDRTNQDNRNLGENSGEYLCDVELQSSVSCQSPNKDDKIQTLFKNSGLNPVERLRKSVLELLETEYAYIKHLETISEHYMSPLKEVSYLGISNLKQLDKMIKELLVFQTNFFNKLTCGILDANDDTDCRSFGVGKSEQLNKITRQLDSYGELKKFDHLLNAIAQTFTDESANFRIYASYCATYSSLQRILHPKNLQSASGQCTFSNPLDTFLSSNGSQSGTLNSVLSNNQQYREFMKPFSSSLMPKAYSNNINNNVNSESILQLKQINQFLSHLDSSSSSASLSLPKSSSGSEQTLSGSTYRTKFFKHAMQTGQTQQKNVNQQNFESYLIKPIQRIVKYPILLKSIATSAQISEKDKSLRHLEDATKHMESITSHVNDKQRIHDEYGFIFEQIERQYIKEGQKFDQISKINHTQKPHINLSIEQLLYFGPVDWLNINEYTSKLKKGINLTQVLFVFNSCVVFICKESVIRSSKGIKLPISSTCHNLNSNNSSSIDTGSGVIPKASQKSVTDFNEVIIRYQSVIPVSEVQVRSVPVSLEGAVVKSSRLLADGGSYQWELFRCSSVNSNSNLLTKSNKKNTTGKIYLLANVSNDARNAFLRKIRFIIRESVRNMSLPLARSPSSKSSTPKKLSSPSSSGGTNTNSSSCSHCTSLSPVRNSADNTKGTQDGVDCDFGGGQIDSTNYTTSIEVNN